MVNNPELSISGTWVLDLSRSDTFEGYLRYLGTPEDDIQAQVVGERIYQSRNVIALDGHSLVIHRDTMVNSHTETFELGEARVADRPDGGTFTTTVSLQNNGGLDSYVVVGTTTTPGGSVSVETLEARRLTEDGLAHVQQIHVRRTGVGGQSITRRTWTRVPMTQDDQMRLLA